MTDIEQKALALIAPGATCEVSLENISILATALTRAIEQHEAFRQEVSDKIEAARDAWPRSWSPLADALDRLIIAKPDPLVEAWNDMFPRGDCGNCVDAEILRAAIEKRGGKIVWGEG